MKLLIKTLVLASALSVFVGAAAVEAKNITLNCDQLKCQYNERLGKSQTNSFDGYCEGKSSGKDFSMDCHPPKGVTCVNAANVGTHWNCQCTNWDPTAAHSVDIDLICTTN